MTSEELLKEIAALPDEAKRRVEDFISRVRRQHSRTSSPAHPDIPLKDEEFVGMWAGRDDMQNGAAWVRKIREEQWNRHR